VGCSATRQRQPCAQRDEQRNGQRDEQRREGEEERADGSCNIEAVRADRFFASEDDVGGGVDGSMTRHDPGDSRSARWHLPGTDSATTGDQHQHQRQSAPAPPPPAPPPPPSPSPEPQPRFTTMMSTASSRSCARATANAPFAYFYVDTPDLASQR
jgi:hypothetical protein